MNPTHLLPVLTLISAANIFNETTDFETRKIVDGTEAEPDQFTYTVAINCNILQCRCTGSIIDDLYIVSVAHCFLNRHLQFLFNSITIIAGTNNIKNFNDPKRVERSVQKIYIPAGFNFSYKDDIAVLKLNSSLDLEKNHLQKLRLPANANSNNNYTGKRAVLVGFGTNKITYTISRSGTVHEYLHPNLRLHFANISILATDKCVDNYVVDSNLCGKMVKDKWAKHYGGCSGDSGAPLVYKSKVLIGSYIRSPATCNERYNYGVYTRIKSHLDFIENAMSDNTTGMIFKYFSQISNSINYNETKNNTLGML